MKLHTYTLLCLTFSYTSLTGMLAIDVPNNVWNDLSALHEEDSCDDVELPEKYLRALSDAGFKFTFDWHANRNRLDKHDKILIKEFVRREEHKLRTTPWAVLEQGLVKTLRTSQIRTERELAKKIEMWHRWSSKELFNFLRCPEDYCNFCEYNEKTYDYLAWVAFYELCRRTKAISTKICFVALVGYFAYYLSQTDDSIPYTNKHTIPNS